MSFYRTLLAAVVAIAVSAPVFAQDAANPSAMQQNPSANAAAPAAAQNPSANAPAMQQAAPADQSAQAPAADQSASAPTDAKVNINTATAKELMAVKGITSAKAKAIVAYRKKHGSFKAVEDLAKVRGFKKVKSATMQSIEAQVSVE